MCKPSSFAGWESWPENVSVRSSNAYGYDLQAYREQLLDDGDRLFVANTKLCLRVIEVGDRDSFQVLKTQSLCAEVNIDSTQDLEDYLQASRGCKLIRIFLVPQEYSWGRLVVSAEAFRKLCAFFGIFPAFLDVVRVFGEKTSFNDETYNGFRLQDNDGSAELSYIIKHVEEHERTELKEPWSVRQIGVYHMSNHELGDLFIILNPSRSFLRRLKKVKEHPEVPCPWEFHMMLLSSAMERWRWCISDLEQRYVSMKTKAQLSSVSGDGEKEPFSTGITFDDTQDIQVLQDKCTQLSQFLEMNHAILQQFDQDRGVLNQSLNPSRKGLSLLSSLATEADSQKKRVETVLKRIDGTLSLVRAILDFRSLASLRQNSRNMAEMTRLSQRENELVVELAKKASRDTDTLKTMTLLTLIYLPASFVANVMAMQYISVGVAKKRITIHFADEFWIFLSMTILLLCATMGAYCWWARRNKPNSRTLTSYFT